MLLASGVLSAALITWMLAGRGSSNAEVVDNTREVEALLDARSKDAGTPLEDCSGPWPPLLLREPLSEEVAAKFYPAIGKVGYLYDPTRGMRREGNMDFWRPFPQHPMKGWRIRTNELGLREDVDPSGEPVDLCVLVLGDNQTEGVCRTRTRSRIASKRRCARRIQTAHRVWNAGMGARVPITISAPWNRSARSSPIS